MTQILLSNMKSFAKSSIVCLAGMGLMMSSCNDYFDTVPGEETTLDKTFASRDLTLRFMANIYWYIPNEHMQRFGAQSQTAGVWTGASSEAEYTWDFVKSHEINNGSLNATSSLCNWYWIGYYKAISKANTFLQHIDENNELTQTERDRYRNEVRALRAIYSFFLFRIYGPFVIREDVIEPDASASQMDLPRNSVDECLAWLDSELSEAAAGLPEQIDGEANWGHITKDIAEAYRAKVWLYGASPLFNGNTYYANMINEDGTQLFPQQVDNNKWQKARDYYAAWLGKYTQYILTLRDNSGNPVTDVTKADPYQSLRAYQYVTSVPPCEEVIFYRKDGSDNLSYEMTPYHRGDKSIPGDYCGGSGLAVTQEMVDLYFMSDGTRIDDSAVYAEYAYGPQPDGSNTYPGDDAIADDYLLYKKTYKEPLINKTTFIDGKREVLGQYYNREPRFYTDITFNQAKWLTSTAIYSGLAYDGNSGAGCAGHDFSHTGYLRRKGATSGSWGSGGQCIVQHMRVAEIYLDYAETLIECQNAGITGAGDQYQTALDYINKIRARAGIPGYAFTSSKDARNLNCIVINKDYETVRNVLRRERTIELAFENHRYFDVRRWKVGTMAQGDGWVYPTYHRGGEGGAFWGLSVQKNELKGFYEKTVFETRVFTERTNLFPIPQDDINRGKLIKQNTGWQSEDI